jgi:pimeloyl-ACP methyl ester carboxylesterase
VPDWRLGLFGGFREGDALEFEARIRTDFANAWSSLLAGAGSDARLGPCELATGSMLALWRSMTGRDYRLDLATLRVPLLAVLGGDSNLYDAAGLGCWFAASVPHAEVIRYAMTGHSPHIAAPDRFARDVAAFAARREAVAQHPADVAVSRAGTRQLAPPAQVAA